MYHYRQQLISSNPSGTRQMNSEAFTARFVPPTQKEVTSKLLKANAVALDEPTKVTVSSQATPTKKKLTTSKTSRSKPSKFEGTTHASLLEESRKLKALEPSVKSLVQGNNNSSVFRRLKTKPPLESHQHRNHNKANKQKEPSTFVPIPLQLTPTILHGEKLVTVGGYIISVQPPSNENVHCVVRPRVSSDVDGLELEIKIDGCPPSEIKVEKRYETLIVIGCSKTALTVTDNANDDLNNHKEKAKSLDSKQLTLKNLQALIKGHVDSDFDSLLNIPKDHLDRLRELVNVFVPKGINLKDIHISKPDASGKFILKGP